MSAFFVKFRLWDIISALCIIPIFIKKSFWVVKLFVKYLNYLPRVHDSTCWTIGKAACMMTWRYFPRQTGRMFPSAWCVFLYTIHSNNCYVILIWCFKGRWNLWFDTEIGIRGVHLTQLVTNTSEGETKVYDAFGHKIYKVMLEK